VIKWGLSEFIDGCIMLENILLDVPSWAQLKGSLGIIPSTHCSPFRRHPIYMGHTLMLMSDKYLPPEEECINRQFQGYRKLKTFLKMIICLKSDIYIYVYIYIYIYCTIIKAISYHLVTNFNTSICIHFINMEDSFAYEVKRKIAAKEYSIRYCSSSCVFRFEWQNST
jgi:hypothetical protein